MCGHCACGEPPVPEAPPAAAGRPVSLEDSLLARNNHLAAHNREHFRAAGVRVVNVLSSPGSGKTALLERLAALAPPGLRLAALVGDLATDNDARRLREAGLPAVQITTGQACHLEAAMVHRGLEALAEAGHPLTAVDLLLIENVGNLVCPAAFDLGEDLRLVLLSVTEGEDKPLKYPALFHSADVVVISKSDLAEAVDFDRPLAHRNVEQVAPAARLLEVSARRGTGVDALLELLLPASARAAALPVG
ncbi:MAG: hydrogenase nickel incorporation protein HypB [Cyanobacteria bacterium K_Offshore_surface_m2_239]|nr:hydrogenase nickel incorporation protein HypB [Cyanobacteria bacterium K_Offshore_surface_m2_239]